MTFQNDTLTEPDIFHKTSFLCGEFLSLSRQYHEAMVELETVRAQGSLVLMREARLKLEKLTDQNAAMLGSLCIAIRNEERRRANLNKGSV